MAEYIEREALIDNLNHFAPEHYNALINMLIEKQPAADVVEVVHAAWELVRMDENDMPIYRCTNCKTKRYGKPPFCPQCGARMTK